MTNTITRRSAQAPAPVTGSQLSSLLTSQTFQQQVKLALPKHINSEKFIRVVLTELRKNPKLAECDKTSFAAALMASAQLGLEVGGTLGLAYLIPRRNSRQGIVECQFQLGYKGMLQLIRNSGEVSSVSIRSVGENDEFTYSYGLHEDLTHIPSDGDPGPLRYVYAVVRMKDGAVQFDVMSRAQVEAVRDKHAQVAGSSSPWVSHFEEMAKKGLALDTPIPTVNGWACMEDLEVGDTVFDCNGSPTAVIAVSEVKNLPCFQVTFSNGETIVCDDEHRWVAKHGDRNLNRKEFAPHTVNDLYEAKARGEAVVIPVQNALDLPDADLPIDPYLLGYWLGDGSSIHAKITTAANGLDHVKAAIEKAGFKVGATREDPRTGAFDVGVRDGFKSKLAESGLLGNKHIPPAYLRASKLQRLRLLQGLVDSDGHVDNARGRASFCSTKQCLADGVYELLSSLGECPYRRTYIAAGFGVETVAYHVGWTPVEPCALLDRKAERLRGRRIGPYRAIKSIERIESVPTRCIAVASETKTYLAGRSMAVTHNTVLRRLFKYLPVGTELATAVAMDEAGDRSSESDNLAGELLSANAEPQPLPQAVQAKVACIDAEQGKTVLAVASRVLTPIGQRAFRLQLAAMYGCTPEGFPGDLPADAFSDVMAFLADAANTERWNSGRDTNNDQIVPQQEIDALTPREPEQQAEPQEKPATGKAQPTTRRQSAPQPTPEATEQNELAGV